MKKLWQKALELFRRHIILWVPCTVAGILILALGKLEKAQIQWFIHFFQTQRSVLGGEAQSGDLSEALHRATMFIYPLGLLKEFLDVCFFVVALTTTKSLVQSILEEQKPDMVAAVRGVVPRFREVLLFSVKYMAVLAVFAGIFIVLGSSPLTSDRFHEFLFSKKYLLYAFSLVGEGCLAWLLLPAAIRLLRPPGSPTISTRVREMGTAFAVIASAGALALGFLTGKAESGIRLDNQGEGLVVAVVNTVIINAPQILLYIALALMAIQESNEETSLSAVPAINWRSKLSDWVRRGREWRNGSTDEN